MTHHQNHRGHPQQQQVNPEMLRQFAEKFKQKPTGTTQSANHYNESPPRDLLFSVLTLAIVVGIGVVVWFNIQPYIGAMDALLWGSANHPLIAFILGIPLIGWILTLFKGIVTSVLGTMIWAFFQVLELLPNLLNSRESIKSLLAGVQRIKPIPVSEGDPQFIRRAKLKYNRKPITWLRKARIASTLAYLVDFIFCSVYYPPIKGGLKNLGLFLQAGTLEDIDLRNLALSLVTLFAVELFVWVLMWMKERDVFMGRSHHG